MRGTNLQNEQLFNLYIIKNIRMVKQKIIQWTNNLYGGTKTCMEILIGKFMGRGHFGDRPSRIKIWNIIAYHPDG
jgi:hypothetical protein